MIDERRAEAISSFEQRRLEVRSMSGEIAAIDEELNKTGPLIFKTACSGGDITPIKERNKYLVARRRNIIKSLGLPEDYADIKYTCEACKDTGYLPNLKMCSCFKKLLLTENIKASGIGRLIEEQSFENFDISVYSFNQECYGKMQNVLSSVTDFANNFSSRMGKNFLFMGKTGTGKTHISTSIAKVVIESGYYVLYDSAQNIVSAFENDKFKSGYGVSYEPVADKYLECDLLIIDDLGTEFVNQFTVSCLYNLFNTRRNRGLSTIVSTNLEPKDLATKYEDRIYSRIVGSDYTVLFFAGRDFRLYGKR